MRELKCNIDVRDEIQALQQELLGLSAIMGLYAWATKNSADINEAEFRFFALSCEALADKLRRIDEFLRSNPTDEIG